MAGDGSTIFGDRARHLVQVPVRIRPLAFLAAAVGILALAALPVFAGCDGCGSQATPPTKEAAAALSAVAAPTDMLAEVILPTPDTTWRAIQGTVGGFLALTAPTFSGLLAAAYGATGLSGLVEKGFTMRLRCARMKARPSTGRAPMGAHSSARRPTPKR
jgi:hypothetical protein